jgi:phenylalanine-4-hydroxylase
MRLSREFFEKHSVGIYIDGLKKTGIPIDRIPKVSDMNRLLGRFGWGAVAVHGFIPPSVFMEFQARHILPISCDMRTIDHLNYTPAPDIVHEAAGHAPIIADADYAAYLRSYATVAFKAIRSAYDVKLFQAIRHLSDIKEAAGASELDIAEAEQWLADVVEEGKKEEPSEAALIARMNWWTVEYGLVGSLKNPQIYGAGLLSSVSESYNALKSDVKKIPFGLSCMNYGYDITRPQPQLFVAKNFPQLSSVLRKFSQSMAFAKGGVSGLQKAKRSGLPNTVELDTGLQLSGIVSEFDSGKAGPVHFVKFSGPFQLSFEGSVLPKQTVKEHAQGFSTPIGKIKKSSKPLSGLSDGQLRDMGVSLRKPSVLSFQSGVTVRGTPFEFVRRNGKLLVIRWRDCRVTWGNRTLFEPSWGIFDQAVGEKVSSVYAGAADATRYPQVDRIEINFETIRQSNETKRKDPRNEIYAEVRKLRESKKSTVPKLIELFARIRELNYDDWLCPLEILELVVQRHSDSILEAQLRSHLDDIQRRLPDQQVTISRGLALLEVA